MLGLEVISLCIPSQVRMPKISEIFYQSTLIVRFSLI